MDNKDTLIKVAYGALALSVVSLLLPVLTYTNSAGYTRSFNIFGVMFDGSFSRFVFAEYMGSFLYGLPFGVIMALGALLGLVGVAAIVLAFVGIRSMSAQYESETPFRLAVAGLVGTAIPSIVLLVLLLASMSQFPGRMRLGAYVIVTPLAMAAALYAVTARHRLSQEEARAQAIAAQYIRPAGDLPIVDRRGGRYHG